MAMDPGGLKSKMKQRIVNGLQAQFGGAASGAQNYTPIAAAQWEKIAEAISGIAMDIVDEIKNNAEVKQGIPISVAKSTTVAPGKIS